MALQKMDFPLYFLNLIGPGRVTFLAEKKNYEKAKLPKICLSFGGSMPIAQILIRCLSFLLMYVMMFPLIDIHRQ